MVERSKKLLFSSVKVGIRYSYIIPIFNSYPFDCCTHVVPVQKTKGARLYLTPSPSVVGDTGFEPVTPCL